MSIDGNAWLMSVDARTAWLDVSAGVAGDMVLGALLDAGASIDIVRAAVDAVIPGAVELSTASVVRAGLRSTKLTVSALDAAPPHRRWSDVRVLLERAELAGTIRRDALAVFTALAEAEGRVHGVAPADVHFHEVGALDSIADVVGACAAVADLHLGVIVAGPIALGSGEVHTEHGALPVPAPAVLEMVRGWMVSGGGSGELATPTGVALVTTLATANTSLPAMRVDAVGVGAGTRDTAGRANVVRVVLGEPASESAWAQTSSEVVIEANVDDLDPRAWPAALGALLDAGASDAWLTPILMKKGRPAHTVHALAPRERIPGLRQVMIEHTSTIGVREIAAGKFALPRMWVPVDVANGVVRIKIAYWENVILRATPEFDDASELATRIGRSVPEVLAQAARVADALGLAPGERLPAG